MYKHSPFPLRPHHAICLNYFCGNGYSTEFTENMKAVTDFLIHEPYSEIILVCRTDEICSCCPHNIDSFCRNKEKVLKYDNKVLELLKISKNDVITWSDLYSQIKSKILSANKINEICFDCQWFSICKNIKSCY